jgi:hypothetical protein
MNVASSSQRQSIRTILCLNRVFRSRTPFSRLKHDFLRCLRADLKKLGIPVTISLASRQLQFDMGPGEVTSERITELMKNERKKRTDSEGKFVKFLLKNGIQKEFINGADLKLDSIKPKVVFCSSLTDRWFFRLCMLLQSVPAQRLLYRQISAVVRDEGQPGSPIIGAFGLASPIRALACRDRVLRWDSAPEARKKGLQSSMQLAVCIAVPPYSYLRAGKLIAALAASDLSADEFHRKYHPHRLKSVVTTSATGLHSPIFNRVMVCRGGLYRRIGETSGYSTLAFSRATLSAARALVIHRDGECPENRTIQVLKRALNLCNAPREKVARLGLRKGVYLADASRLKSRVGGHSNDWPTQVEIVKYWRDQVLDKCLARREILTKVADFRFRDFLSEMIQA